jgi:hypothetical protein
LSPKNQNDDIEVTSQQASPFSSLLRTRGYTRSLVLWIW